MTTLADRHARLIEEAGKPIRARDAAARLGTTEAALVASGATGPATPLRPDWAALIGAMPQAGRIMALTRNEHAVHERHGQFVDVSTGPGHILVLGPDIDLRLFPRQWAHAYALGGERPSIQTFDKDGVAAHKIFATEATDRDGWARILADFAVEAAAEPPAAPPAAPAGTADEGVVDASALRQDWLALRDTHDFFPMLRRLKVGRVQALRLAGEEWAQPLSPAAPRQVLEQAGAAALPIMIFVGNPGCIQIHSGTVERLKQVGTWFNVLDPRFNLHLSEPGVVAAWRVRKPTDDGIVTSIEGFDAEGRAVAMMFGKRKPGTPEDPAWRELAEALA